MLQERKYFSAMLGAAVSCLALLLIFSIPFWALDLLISVSFAFSFLTLFLSFTIRETLEFSTVPSWILLLTIFRLTLNIASTRLILTKGEAGSVIGTFGNSIMQGNPLVGFLLFTLLTLINFIVVTKGAGRISEVAARFSLEALPGRQAALENQGRSINANELKAGQKKLLLESEFYGAMDGTSKFIKGEAIASLFIIIVNLIGGALVGVLKFELDIYESVLQFSSLTIGDSLVTQIPAFLMSIAAGILVSRNSEGALGETLAPQLLLHPTPLRWTALLLGILAFCKGMPFFILAALSLSLFLLSIKRKKNESSLLKEEKRSAVELIEIRLGLQWIEYAEAMKQEISLFRRTLIDRWGVPLPSTRIGDDLTLPKQGFSVRIKGLEVARESAATPNDLYKRISQTLLINLADLLTRQAVIEIIEKVRVSDPLLVEELNAKIKTSQFFRLFQLFLKEGIPLIETFKLFEAISESISNGEAIELEMLYEKIRSRLARSISNHFFGLEKVAHVITLDPKIEQTLHHAKQQHGKLLLRPLTIKNLIANIDRLLKDAQAKGIEPILLTQPSVRKIVRQAIERELPTLSILAHDEVISEIQYRSVGVVSSEVLAG